MTNWVKAALTKDVSDDSIQQLNINGCKVALYRCVEEYFATSDVCTHAYALLSDGWLDGYEIECPLHGARFDVRTGAALTSPAETALATYPVRVAGDAVEIDVTSAPSNPDAST